MVKVSKAEEQAIQEAVEAGYIEFCDALPVEEFNPQWLADFSRRILDTEWDDLYFISDETSILDFNILAEPASMLDAIYEVYKVDCSDIKGLNLLEVMRRCYQTVDSLSKLQ